MSVVQSSLCARNCTIYTAPTVYHESSNVWKTEYAFAQCTDCLRDLCMWKNRSHPFWQLWDLNECKDHDIDVDEEKISHHSHNPNRDWAFHLMIIAIVTYKPIQYWVEAPGVCKICMKEETMTSTYDNVKKNGIDVVQIHQWKIKSVADGLQ